MASVAASVARLTNPSSQTARGKRSALLASGISASALALAPRIRRERAVLPDRYPDPFVAAVARAEDRESAVVADAGEPLRIEDDRRAARVVAIALEYEPDAVVSFRTR